METSYTRKWNKVLERYTIVINEGSKKYKVSKIVFYGGGTGFAVLSPCHVSRKGYLGKFTIDQANTASFLISADRNRRVFSG